ncbi:coilin [Osmerus eperlanus]|uniref:coilin n=1 Tax=Osmerus eperlanus TaxID=29151 RepID=UPI002E1215D1
MASSSVNSIRVRLYFDYPPPAVPDCRMCWVLVDLNKCRVVADLASIIREKFDFSRKNVLNLYIEDCYLPHTESIYVVRDNDSIRVRVDRLTPVSGLEASCPSAVGGNAKKRGREAEEEEPSENGVSVPWKTKKKKKKHDKSQERESTQTADNDRSKEKKKKKKEKKGKEGGENLVSTPTKAPSTTVSQPGKSTKKAQAAPTPAPVNRKVSTTRQNVSTDSSDSSTEEEEAPKKTPMQKPPSKTPSTLTPTATKDIPKAKTPATKPPPPPPSSSSETDSSSDEAASSKAPAKPPPKKTPLPKPTSSPANTIPSSPIAGTKNKLTPPGPQSLGPPPQTINSSHLANGSTQQSKKVPEKPGCSDSDSSSEDEIRLVIKRPTQGGMGLAVAPAVGDPSSASRGRGRGSPSGGERGRWNPRGGGRPGRGALGQGRGGGEQNGGRGFSFNYEDSQQQQKPSYHSDLLTNRSVVSQNPVASDPKRDYSTLPLLAAPPPVGQKIAFKLLELTENYTPEVSEYKEGKLINFDPTNKQIELQLLSASQAFVQPGKFDLVYENADGSESVEYAVARGSRVTERWESLIEPRLII